MDIVDVRGKACPIPVIETKREFDKLKIGESMKVVSDNEISSNNIGHYIEESGGVLDVLEVNGNYEIDIKKINAVPEVEAELYCPVEEDKNKNYVIYINSEYMGYGDDDLGKILMKAFINNIKEMDVLPSHIIFLNSAVRITTEESPEIDSLKFLEESGVNIISCGTCLNFFELDKDLKIGQISNMYDIMKTLTMSPKIITP